MFKTRPVHVSAGQCQASKLGFHVRNSLASSTYCLPGLYVLHCIISWFSKGWLANADGALSNRTCLSAAHAKQHIRSSCWCSKQNASSNAHKGAGTCACAHLAETVGGKSRLAECRVLRVMPLARLQSGLGRHPRCYPEVLVGPGLVMRLLWRAWRSPEEAGSHKTWHMAGTCSPLSAWVLIRVQPCFKNLTRRAAALTGSSCAIQVVWNSSSMLASTRTHCTMDPLPAIAGQEVGSSALGAMGCCCCTRKY